MRKQRIEGKSHWPCASPDINELRLSRPKLLIAEQNEADTGSIAQPIQPKPPWRQDNICLAHYCFPIIEHSSWLLKQLVTQSTLFQWRANSGSLGQALFQKYYPVSGSCMCSWNSFSFNTAYIFLLFLSFQHFPVLEQVYLLLDHCK